MNCAAGDRNHIHHGVVHYVSDDGIDVFDGSDNEVDHVLAYKPGYRPNGDATANGNGNGFKEGFASNLSAGNHFHHCIAVGSLQAGFDTNEGDDILTEQCVAVDAGSNSFIGYWYAALVFRNNVEYGTDSVYITEDGAPDPVQDHNSWNTPPGKTVAAGSFLNTTFSASWRSWADVAAAHYMEPDPSAPSINNLTGVGAGGADLGAYDSSGIANLLGATIATSTEPLTIAGVNLAGATLAVTVDELAAAGGAATLAGAAVAVTVEALTVAGVPLNGTVVALAGEALAVTATLEPATVATTTAALTPLVSLRGSPVTTTTGELAVTVDLIGATIDMSTAPITFGALGLISSPSAADSSAPHDATDSSAPHDATDSSAALTAEVT